MASTCLTRCLAGNPAKRACVDPHCSVANPFICQICQPTSGCRNMHPGCPDKPWSQLRQYLQTCKANYQSKYRQTILSIDHLIKLGLQGLSFIRKQFQNWRQNAGLSTIAAAVQSKIKKGNFDTLTGKMLAQTYQTTLDTSNMKTPTQLSKECQSLQQSFEKILIKMEQMFLGKNESETLSEMYKCIHKNELVYKVEEYEEMYLLQHIRNQELRKLDIHGQGVKDARPLLKTYFPMLEVLCMTNGSIQAIEPLSSLHLKHLTKLSLENNEISDITIFPKLTLPNLKTLNLSRNLIASISPVQLCNFTDLQVLDVSNNKITDPFPILRGNFPRLDLTNGLDIRDNPITSAILKEFKQDAKQIQMTKKQSNTSNQSQVA